MTSPFLHAEAWHYSPFALQSQPASEAPIAPAGAPISPVAAAGKVAHCTVQNSVASPPPSEGPCPGAGLFHPGMSPLTRADFLGPDHNQRFVAGFGQRLTPPPMKDILNAMSREELLMGLEVMTLQVLSSARDGGVFLARGWLDLSSNNPISWLRRCVRTLITSAPARPRLGPASMTLRRNWRRRDALSRNPSPGRPWQRSGQPSYRWTSAWCWRSGMRQGGCRRPSTGAG